MGISSCEGAGVTIFGVRTLIWLCYYMNLKENQNSILVRVVIGAWLGEVLLSKFESCFWIFFYFFTSSLAQW